jgi:CubicO group peptidase (beta-lactamase class C family)
MARVWRCRLWLAAVILAVSTACTGSPNGSGSGETPAGQQTSSSPEQVAAVFDRLVEGGNTAWIYEDLRAVLVFVGGRPLVERYYDSSAEATSEVASVTKSVMSILVGIAMDEDELGSVEQTLAELLPDYATIMAPEVAGITLRQVLTMTAGLPADTPPSDPDLMPFETAKDWVAAIVSGGLEQPPGEGFAYASAGSHLLSAILVEATGRSVLDYAREKLFDSLGIDTDPAAEPLAVIENLPVYEAASFAWPVDPQGLHLGYTLLKINAPDMAKIGQLMLDGGRWDGEQIVSTRWVAESTRAQVATGAMGRDFGADDYGYHWWVTTADGHDAFAAIGWGGQLIEVVPDLDLVVVVSCTIPAERSVRLNADVLQLLVNSVIAPAIAP